METKTASTPFGQFTILFLEQYHMLKISSARALLLLHILHIQQAHGMNTPIVTQTLADRMGITATAVRAHLRVLETKGLLCMQRGYGNLNTFDIRPMLNKIKTP